MYVFRLIFIADKCVHTSNVGGVIHKVKYHVEIKEIDVQCLWDLIDGFIYLRCLDHICYIILRIHVLHSKVTGTSKEDDIFDTLRETYLKRNLI